MNEHSRKLVGKIINKDKWWDTLSRFIDVLRINIFIVDVDGLIILPPEERKYAGRLLCDDSLGFDLFHKGKNLLTQFERQGVFLEAKNRYDLHTYAIPIKTKNEDIFAYMIVGPVILNKRLNIWEYESMAKEDGADAYELLNEIDEIRIVSYLMINSILDLLSEIVRDNVELSIKEKELDDIRSDQRAITKEMHDKVQKIYSTVRLDELLVTLLDVALKITDTECGSIMIFDEEKENLTIKVSRGLNTQLVKNISLRVGEGIAGLAAKEKSSFIIHGDKADNRISHLLKRPEIKQAVVMPLANQEKVFGVINLHTKKEHSKIDESLDNLQHLSKLVSSAFSFQ